MSSVTDPDYPHTAQCSASRSAIWHVGNYQTTQSSERHSSFFKFENCCKCCKSYLNYWPVLSERHWRRKALFCRGKQDFGLQSNKAAPCGALLVWEGSSNWVVVQMVKHQKCKFEANMNFRRKPVQSAFTSRPPPPRRAPWRGSSRCWRSHTRCRASSFRWCPGAPRYEKQSVGGDAQVGR